MKMAKASEKDIEVATIVVCMLNDVFENDSFPREANGMFSDDEPDWFDPDDKEHLRALYDRLAECFEKAPGALNRVVFGFSTVMNPENEVVDPADSCLALHPKLKHGLAFLEGELTDEQLDEACRQVAPDFDIKYQVAKDRFRKAARGWLKAWRTAVNGAK